MERLFHNLFFKPQPEVSIAELMSFKQLRNELVIEFLERFRRVRSRCSVQIPDFDCGTITVNNI